MTVSAARVAALFVRDVSGCSRYSWDRIVVIAPEANPGIVSAVARCRAVPRDEATFGWLSLEETLGSRSPPAEETRVALLGEAPAGRRAARA